jgi:hypothetical protein
MSRLWQLENQLSAIESTARTVTGELLASNQLLGTMDELQAVGRKTTSAGASHRGQKVSPTDSSQRDSPKLLNEPCAGAAYRESGTPSTAQVSLQHSQLRPLSPSPTPHLPPVFPLPPLPPLPL